MFFDNWDIDIYYKEKIYTIFINNTTYDDNS